MTWRLLLGLNAFSVIDLYSLASASTSGTHLAFGFFKFEICKIQTLFKLYLGRIPLRCVWHWLALLMLLLLLLLMMMMMIYRQVNVHIRNE